MATISKSSRILFRVPTSCLSSRAAARRPQTFCNVLRCPNVQTAAAGGSTTNMMMVMSNSTQCLSSYSEREDRERNQKNQRLQQELLHCEMSRNRRRCHSVPYSIAGARKFSASRFHPSEFTTKLSVSEGTLTVSLPLPGLPGITEVCIPVDAPVRQLMKQLKALDASLSHVDVTNAEGHQLAQSTSIRDVAGYGLRISLGGSEHIHVMGEGSGHSTQTVPAPDLYSKFKAEIACAGRVTMKHEELDALCTKVCKDAGLNHAQAQTLDPRLAECWLNAMVEEGLAFTPNKGRIVLLNPSGPGVSDEIANALRGDDQLVDGKVSVLRKQLNDMHVEERRLQDIKDKLIAKVYRNVTLKKGAVLTFMFAQFGTLAYCVYELYSWDVMEPATYFLMMSYSVGASLYFAANNREASYRNLMDKALKRREAKLEPALGYSRSRHAKLKEEILRFEKGVKILSSRRSAHAGAGQLVTSKTS